MALPLGFNGSPFSFFSGESDTLPLSSPSAHFHGMPLRLLLGEGEKTLLSHAFSTLRPEQVLLVGARDLDPPESSFIEHKNLFTVSAVEVNHGNFTGITSRLIKSSSNKVYIHLDLDVIDPNEFPYVTCPTRDGIRIEKLKNLIDLLGKEFDVVGCSVLEFLPTETKKKATLAVIKLLDSIGFRS